MTKIENNRTNCRQHWHRKANRHRHGGSFLETIKQNMVNGEKIKAGFWNLPAQETSCKDWQEHQQGNQRQDSNSRNSIVQTIEGVCGSCIDEG